MQILLLNLREFYYYLIQWKILLKGLAMKKLFYLVCLPCLFFSTSGFAEDDFFGVVEDSAEFGISQSATSVPDRPNTEAQKSISSFLRSKLPASTLRNIEKAEKVFCYNVAYASPNDDGYIIDDMAVKGSCGELSDAGKKLFHETLWNNTSAFSNSLDNCNISPQIVLRYIYGPDHTDVLLSYPCPAVVFFHGRDIITINASPAQSIIEQISSAYSGLSEKYLSPALMKQMVANGQVTTQDQKEMVRRMNSSETVRKKWNTATPETAEQPETEAQSAETQPTRKGWNKLK